MTLNEIAELTADPEVSLARLTEMVEKRPEIESNHDSMILLAHLLAGSDALYAWLSRRPEDIDWLFTDNVLHEPRDEKTIIEHCQQLLQTETKEAALRIFRSRELIRIAARELSDASHVTEALTEWSQVAEAAIDAAIKVADDEARELYGAPLYSEFDGDIEKEARFAALGMGKLGGGELNISSDVDLIYLHTSDNGETTGGSKGVVGLHEFFVRVARRVTSLLNDMTDLGSVFRVDLDLRPEGRSGELTNSIGAMEIYYESWGQSWERQAFIKAKHVGGGSEVSEEILDRLQPFIYRKYIDRSAIDDVAVMKGKIDAKLRVKKSKKADDNIKLGHGGIREIEFVVQALQVLSGAHYPELRSRSTLEAIEACISLGLISKPHYEDLKEAYLFYRRLENRIQYHLLNQTHNIPDSDYRRSILARQMGIAKNDENDAASSLMSEVERRRKRVRQIFDLFFSKEEVMVEMFPVPMDEELADEITEWLDSIRFDNPKRIAKELIELRNGKPFTHPSAKSKDVFDEFGPILVQEAILTAWPDNVIVGFSKLVAARRSRDTFFNLINNNRKVIRLLAALFSSSESLSNVLIRTPDTLEMLVSSDLINRKPDAILNQRRFAEVANSDMSNDKKLAQINLLKAFESLRLGIGRILEALDRFDVMIGLTYLAESYLTAILKLAEDKVGATDESYPYSLFACGKLARREMNYASDLDLIIFYDGGEEARDYVTKLIQAAMKMSSLMTPYGTGYEIDMRLRPEGEKGPLAVSFDGAKKYYKTRGEAWERLALVGARPVVGDEVFGKEVSQFLSTFVSEPALTADETNKIGKLRDRIANEKVKPGAVDIKFGRGGLIEIEFITQFLILEGVIEPDQEAPVTINAVRSAKEFGKLSRDDAIVLERAYIVYRSIEDALRMDSAKAVNVAPKKREELARAARRSAIPGVGPDTFLDTIKESKKSVRTVYERFMATRAEPVLNE